MDIAISAGTGTPHLDSGWAQFSSFFREELKPYPGRLRAAFVRVAGALLAMWIGLALDAPEMSAVLALAFFGSAVDRDESKKISLGVPPAVLVILLCLTLYLKVFGVSPLARTVAFVIIVFSSLYLLQAAQAGSVFLLAGIFGKVFLELWDSGYPTELIQKLQLWIVGDLALAGLCALAVAVVFGNAAKDPVKEFRKELAGRFDLLARSLAGPANLSENDNEKLRAEAFHVSDRLLLLLKGAEKKDASIKLLHRNFAELIQVTALLFHQSVVLQTYSPRARQRLGNTLRQIGNRCAAIAQTVRSGDVRSGDAIASAQELPSLVDDPFVSTMVSTVNLAENVFAGKALLQHDQEQESSKGFLRPDAFINPAYLNNAARAFAAAFACYCLISGAKWSGIGTAVTTCLITSLTTVEEARQKQSLRIAGAVLGGFLGLLVIVYILPMDFGVTGLSIVTAFVTLLGGWIYAGSPKLSYAGVQLVLCYYLGVFGENKTPTSLTTMRDRIVGILIGNIAMWIFFDRIQPAWTIDSSRNAFADELAAVGRLANARAATQDSQAKTHSLADERDAFLRASTALRAMSDGSHFGWSRGSKLQQREAPQIRHTEKQLQQLFSFEFAEIEASLLRLPGTEEEAKPEQLSASLLALSSMIRDSNTIRSVGTPLDDSGTPVDEMLLARIRTDFANLFSLDGRSA